MYVDHPFTPIRYASIESQVHSHMLTTASFSSGSAVA
jgi:hypothetical protein